MSELIAKVNNMIDNFDALVKPVELVISDSKIIKFKADGLYYYKDGQFMYKTYAKSELGVLVCKYEASMFIGGHSS